MFEITRNITKGIVGRREEMVVILSALEAGKHILLEGPPGTSKSTLLRSIARELNIPIYIIEGNIDLTPAKLVGHFNPSKVMSDNYNPLYFEKGPLTKAMEEGGILYIEEFNRMPADVSNVLITPMEEGLMNIPRYGLVQAHASFRVVAAQNPYDDVGTVRVSRAFMDRICLIKMDYQSEEDEQEIVRIRTGSETPEIIAAAVDMVRRTRTHPEIKLGASVRAAIDLVDVFHSLQRFNNNKQAAFTKAAQLALANKIWLNELTTKNPGEVVEDIWENLKVKHKDFYSLNSESTIVSEETVTNESENGLQQSEKKKMTI